MVSSDFCRILFQDFERSTVGKLITDKVSKDEFEPIRDPPRDLDKERLGVTDNELPKALCLFFCGVFWGFKIDSKFK